MIDKSKNIGLATIRDLHGEHFCIPNYQRGYRWDEEQVKDLLNDIQAFISKDNKTDNEIYLLQPLVLATRNDKVKTFAVVDGQQRLTTIFLLLRYLYKKIRNTYTIEYQTREKSWEFLSNIKSKTQNEASCNVDFYHIYVAYQVIEKWFKDNNKDEDEVYIADFREVLLNRVVFIYYIIEQEHEIKVFTRLNVLKIPLTDSELVKAMFLNRNNFASFSDYEKKAKQHKIAEEWNQIESTLQNDEFWLFIHNRTYDKPTRIDFILELIMKDKYIFKRVNKDKYANNNHGMYRYFEDVVKEYQNKGIEKLWSYIKQYFQIFKEWYNDYRLYHYIGFLVTVKNKDADKYVVELLEKWRNPTTTNKGEFEIYLRKEIVKTLRKDKPKDAPLFDGDFKHNFLDNLINEKSIRERPEYKRIDPSKKDDITEYLFLTKFDTEYTKRCCVNILLLHDVELTIQYNDKLVANEKYGLPILERFPFHLYSLDNWDVEHIRPNADDGLEKEENRLIYLLMVRKYYGIDNDLTNEIIKYVNDESVDKRKNYRINDYSKDDMESMSKKGALFDSIIKKIDMISGQALGEEKKNRIWNFTLLDSSTNREYGNHIFPYKRAYIAEKEKGRKLYYGIDRDPSYNEKDPKSLKRMLVSANDRKNEIVKLLLAFDKSSDDVKDRIKEYINSIKKDSPIYELKNEKSTIKRPEVVNVSDDICNRYSLEYVMKANRNKNNGMQFKLSERTEAAPFVLTSTKNVFTKYYSKKIETMMHWTEDDAMEYWKDIKLTLKEYFDILSKEFINA